MSANEIEAQTFPAGTEARISASIQVAVIILIALLAFAQTFSSGPYEGIADGMRYLASGHSLITEGHGYSNPIRYDQLATSFFPPKPYPYPSQLVQLLLGGLIALGASPNISTLALANLIAFAGSLFAIFGILRVTIDAGWALAGTAFIGLTVPQFRYISLNFATEAWMMLFGLIALWAILKGRYVLAGVCLGFGFFFRAQISAWLPASIGNPFPSRRRIMGLLLGISASAILTWLALKFMFPKAGESTTGFYGRVFTQKYTLSPSQAIQVVSDNLYDFKWLWFSFAASFALLIAARILKAGAAAREVTAFYVTSTVTMALFAFYMAGTVGDGVSDRYFVHLICLFWLALFLLIGDVLTRRTASFRHSRYIAATTSGVLVLISAFQVDWANAKQNFMAEDFPPAIFESVGAGSIIMVSYGTPVISLQIDKARKVTFPPYETFIAGDNQKVDFLFLDARNDGIPEDWQASWDVEEIRDGSGVTFKREASFESPARSSRLFRRVSP
jgi:hypothetical protein